MRITNERAHSATLILVGALPSLLALFVVLHREARKEHASSSCSQGAIIVSADTN